MRRIVRIRPLPIPAELLGGDYRSDPGLRADLQHWVGQIWADKDAQIEQLLGDGHLDR
ncbi:MAG: hypothetical protein IPL59_16280 [Candidatus Competibacteraceae bacterium]|uniref:Uncharacterized protein n=1 Tax=Candidatus Contendobacter odensis Run_B_J11 TaxID=1400861 RepID=A0A7U7J280_9GAMM|nr:hypothetical protein [Candidatus Contendobacter odensis]MBK8536542.1 hypothetical protein [Candidatus Competibacteraceae bacterium]MBK8754557.1 hypothetical protein [Candidatus Competibacteraceae bacterium]CDH43148.1 hypothetical protein BN874_1070006 [Candidatus Contendobacter odensis Run_B_J11]